MRPGVQPPGPAAGALQAFWLPLALLCSGASCLVFETVWLRMLVRAFGVTVHAASAVLTAFMAGMALGSWAAGAWSSRAKPGPGLLRLYGWIELAAAACGLAATAVAARMPQAYAGLSSSLSLAPAGRASLGLRFCLACAALAAPAALMGATLPVLSQALAGGGLGARLARIYGFNTLGAVAGVLAAGFLLIPAFGERGAALSAAALNLAAGALALAFAGRTAADGVESRLAEAAAARPCPASLEDRGPWLFFLALAAASGACGLAYEVLWTRMLVLLTGTSVYAFSVMLAVYLAGAGLGSLFLAGPGAGLLPATGPRSSPASSRSPPGAAAGPAVLFGLAQLAVFASGVASLYAYRWLGAAASHPDYLYSPLNKAGDFLHLFWLAGLVIFPVTFCLGLLPPLLAGLAPRGEERPGASVGALLALNTAGAAAGSAAAGLWLIPAVGAQRAFAAACGLNLLLGCAALCREWSAGRWRPGPGWRPAALALAALALAGGLAARRDFFLEIVQRRLAGAPRAPGEAPPELMFHEEEAAAAVTGVRRGQRGGSLLVNGITVSDKGIAGALMARIPLLLHPDPASALVVCLGVGNTFMAAAGHVGRLDAVELVRGVARALPRFQPGAAALLAAPAGGAPPARLFVDDGRHFLLTSRERYDAVIVDASPPIFSAGAVNLYSLEFLRLADARLRPGGILALWVPLPCFEADFWGVARNFVELFPRVAAWAHPDAAGVLLVGSRSALDVSSAAFAGRLAGLPASAGDGLGPELLSRGFVLSEERLRARALAYRPVTDDRPSTEFPLWRFLTGREFWLRPFFLLRDAGGPGRPS